MTTKLAKQDRLGPKWDEETQTLVNLMFIYIMSDPFMNGEALKLALYAAAKQMQLPPERADKLAKNIMEFHYKAQGPLKGFCP